MKVFNMKIMKCKSLVKDYELQLQGIVLVKNIVYYCVHRFHLLYVQILALNLIWVSQWKVLICHKSIVSVEFRKCVFKLQ